MGQNSAAFSCTEENGDKIFPPLEIDCPQEGERLVVTFKWRYPGETGGGNVGVQRTIAATHGGGLTEGIVVGPSSFHGDCSDTFLLASEPDDIFFQGTFSESCSTGLSSPSLCIGVSMNGDQNTLVEDAVVVFNTGGCQDKIKIEVSLAGIFGGPGECVSPLTLECQGETSLNGGSNESNPFEGGFDTGFDSGKSSTDGTCSDEAIGACVLAGFFTDDLNLYSDCGFFTKKIDKNWCYDTDLNENICCGDGSGHCCEANAGTISGIVIAFVVFLTACILACCACCSCCPLYNRCCGRRSNGNNGNEGANVEMAPPQEPKPEEN